MPNGCCLSPPRSLSLCCQPSTSHSHLGSRLDSRPPSHSRLDANLPPSPFGRLHTRRGQRVGSQLWLCESRGGRARKAFGRALRSQRCTGRRQPHGARGRDACQPLVTAMPGCGGGGPQLPPERHVGRGILGEHQPGAHARRPRRRVRISLGRNASAGRHRVTPHTKVRSSSRCEGGGRGLVSCDHWHKAVQACCKAVSVTATHGPC